MTWPRVTVVTPSFNQAQYLEATIRSVLEQDYPNLEYIVVDGGSTDGSVEIIKKYAHRLAWWVSEPDRGQSHAINKGLSRATGDVIAYLNSDDYYLPGTLRAVVEYATANPGVDLIHGTCRYVDVAGHAIGRQTARISRYDEAIDLWDVWWNRRQLVQPEVFWTRRIAERVGLLREDLHYVMDYEYWLRILRAGARVERVDRELTCFRFTPEQKSNHSQAVAEELLSVIRLELWDPASPLGRTKRFRLQGRWLFDARFRRMADDAVAAGLPRRRRWIKLAGIVCRHPKVVTAPGFLERVTAPLRRSPVTEASAS